MTPVRSAFFALLLLPVAASAADPGLLSLVMPDAKMIAGMQVEQSKASPFGHFVLQQMQAEDEKFQKFIADSGFDPRRDVREIMVASTSDAKSRGLIMARGSFDLKRIRSLARKNSASIKRYSGFDIFTAEDDDLGSITFLDNSFAIMGNLPDLQAAIDRRGAKNKLDPALAAKIKEVSAANDAWFVSVLPMAELAGRVPDPGLNGMMKGNALQGIQQASGGVRFGPNVLVNLEAVTRSEKDATALMDVVRFIASLIQMNRDNERVKDAASIVDGMSLKADSNNVVRLSLTLPEAQLEKMFQPAKEKKAPRKTAVVR